MPQSTPAPIACILINYRIPEDTIKCILSLRDSGKDAFKVFLINNFPSDGSGMVLKDCLRASGMDFAYFEPAENLGYTGGMNLGIRAALAEGRELVLILNNDTMVAPDFARQAWAAYKADPDAVIAGLVLDAETGVISHNIGKMSRWTGVAIDTFAPGQQEGIDFVSGCMMLIPAMVLRKVGLFDERYFMYREDFDLCLRFKESGVRILHRPQIIVTHKVSSAADRSGTPKEYYRMRNQCHIVNNRLPWQKRAFYWIFMAGLLLYNLRRPRMLALFLRAIRDALSGRLGPVT